MQKKLKVYKNKSVKTVKVKLHKGVNKLSVIGV